MAKIGLLGCGVVGSGVREVLENNPSGIAARAGEPLELKKILDKRDFPGERPGLFTADPEEVFSDPEISVVVECMGGLEPAFSFAKQALCSGRSFVTSNKELIAQKGDELLALAKENNVNLLFEASVGGGIPIIKPLHVCLGADRIERVCGILNGTTNYILTEMFEKGTAFADALAEAQRLGYAERDPSADVQGLDAARKTAILASLCFGSHLLPTDVSTEGITGITSEDVAFARAQGGAVKLIGRAWRGADGKVCAAVSPMLVPGDNQLSGVSGVFNGIMVEGDAVGRVLFCGPGAGKLPTASAVVSDVIDAVKAKGNISSLRWGARDASVLAPHESYKVSAWLLGRDKPRRLDGVTEGELRERARRDSARILRILGQVDS